MTTSVIVARNRTPVERRPGPGRQAAVAAGIPIDVPALTINKVCLSGIDASALAEQWTSAREFDVIVASGQESMTQAPHLLEKSRAVFKYGDVTMKGHLAYDGLYDIFTDQAVGGLTESRNEGVVSSTREEQDEFAAPSHQRAASTWQNGVFDEDGVSAEIPQRKGDPIVFAQDEGIRADTTTGTSPSQPAQQEQEQSGPRDRRRPRRYVVHLEPASSCVRRSRGQERSPQAMPRPSMMVLPPPS